MPNQNDFLVIYFYLKYVEQIDSNNTPFVNVRDSTKMYFLLLKKSTCEC